MPFDILNAILVASGGVVAVMLCPPMAKCRRQGHGGQFCEILQKPVAGIAQKVQFASCWSLRSAKMKGSGSWNNGWIYAASQGDPIRSEP
jgi:hypothetical protein